MASHYVAAIKTHQPTGPYLIGGHCDGTWVAHEMAVQLRDRGETVAYLALVDIAPPARDLPSKAWLPNLVERLAHYGRDGRLGYALAYQLKLRLENQLLLRFGSAASRRVRAVREAHKRAFGRYEIEYDHRTPLHLVRSTELARTMDQIPWYDGLRDGENDVVVTDIESTHARLLMEPETRELAHALSSGLDAAASKD
jgi:thioesterase domain-containing protein